MARPKKSDKFTKLLSPLDVSELKQLKSEVIGEIRQRERKVLREKQEETARKLRDKLRIGQKISYKKRGGDAAEAEIAGILADKILVITDDGRKSSVALISLLDD